ncbi:hypothetical protein G1K46_09950 [Tenacibaculum finnmarkense]|uniref:hypothetical protein n=1 Tax=Tenacibaculum finnmarkense TaxID=2781243 RepID=UPI00187BA8EF|nr:hypothetical protein [Tenacibaculum finnmarkense]MBE7648416.1 hypothetical protein [Tenacibaculum finnmarkense genomovar ulcerans]MCG8236777.1 hypothetical protein [Tenacibaculum finnmarkense genomovar ulcerans]MCG8763051.1 hypothetical protein [Tenacibaculum finnmarkense]MCG8788320.1 hypothetical protein [Tenacibaculum finnmarkense]MCG8831149.1 hypothetical protein [Tenacibaculum finnmarkense]
MKSKEVNFNYNELEKELKGNQYKKHILAFVKLVEKHQRKEVGFDILYKEYLDLVPFSNAETRLRRLLTRNAETGNRKDTVQSKQLNIPLNIKGIKIISKNKLEYKENGDVISKSSDNNIYTFILEENLKVIKSSLD